MANAANHGYLMTRMHAAAGPVLDFGCGRGDLIVAGRRQGLDVNGADIYDGPNNYTSASILAEARPFIGTITNGLLPYPSEAFVLVVANMVFEHVPDEVLRESLGDICRVLKPGGYFLALFPTADVWYEGHLNIYFPHWLSAWPRAQRSYLRLCHRLGFGAGRAAARSSDVWAECKQRYLNENVFHHRTGRIDELWRHTFGAPPVSCAADYMRFRVGQRAKLIPSRALAFVCHKRAGRVLLVRKRD